jgi:hypothetical protein
MSQLDPALVPHHEGPGRKTFVTKAREQKKMMTGSISAVALSVSTGAKSILGAFSNLAQVR